MKFTIICERSLVAVNHPLFRVPNNRGCTSILVSIVGAARSVETTPESEEVNKDPASKILLKSYFIFLSESYELFQECKASISFSLIDDLS